MPVGGALDVRLELYEQARHEVDGTVELWHLFEVQGHPQVVLRRVEPDPRHRVLPGDVVGVIRLVLVPHEGQGDLGHGPSSLKPDGARPTAAGRRLAPSVSPAAPRLDVDTLWPPWQGPCRAPSRATTHRRTRSSRAT